LYYTASGIVTLCRWPSGAQVVHCQNVILTYVSRSLVRFIIQTNKSTTHINNIIVSTPTRFIASAISSGSLNYVLLKL